MCSKFWGKAIINYVKKGCKDKCERYKATDL